MLQCTLKLYSTERQKMELLREKFLKAYANIPLSMRNDIILVYKNSPLSWYAVFIEVVSESKVSDEILKELETLNLI